MSVANSSATRMIYLSINRGFKVPAAAAAERYHSDRKADLRADNHVLHYSKILSNLWDVSLSYLQSYLGRSKSFTIIVSSASWILPVFLCTSEPMLGSRPGLRQLEPDGLGCRLVGRIRRTSWSKAGAITPLLFMLCPRSGYNRTSYSLQKPQIKYSSIV